MSAPPILALRRTIVAHLKADETVIAVLPAARQFGERSQDLGWPFSRVGEFEGAPGHEIRGAVHVFSKGDFTDEVNTIVERIATSLDGAVLTLDEDVARRANIALLGTRVIPDGAEQSAWHGIVTILATIARDCTDPRD